DAHGFECHSLACPRCHLGIPRALLEVKASFMSILGSPACGKSYYLATLTWELRRILPTKFALAMTDVDPQGNQALTVNEEALFLNPRTTGFLQLSKLIAKTKLTGDLYDTVNYSGQSVIYPRPYLFALRTLQGHPRHGRGNLMSRVLCVYDNAG